MTDQITQAAQAMLDNHDAFMGVATYDKALEDRVVMAACFAAAAYDAAPDPDSGTHALLRSFLLALIDPAHADLDYLREDPDEGARVREARQRGEECGVIRHG